MWVVGMFFQKSQFKFHVLGVHLCFKPWPFLWTPDVTAYMVSLLVYISFNPQFQASILYLPQPPCPITWCPPMFPFSGKVNTLLLVTQVRGWKSTLIPPSHASGFSQSIPYQVLLVSFFSPFGSYFPLSLLPSACTLARTA